MPRRRKGILTAQRFLPEHDLTPFQTEMAAQKRTVAGRATPDHSAANEAVEVKAKRPKRRPRRMSREAKLAQVEAELFRAERRLREMVDEGAPAELQGDKRVQIRSLKSTLLALTGEQSGRMALERVAKREDRRRRDLEAKRKKLLAAIEGSRKSLKRCDPGDPKSAVRIGELGRARNRLESELADVEAELASCAQARKASKRQVRERFALIVQRSNYLTEAHYRTAQALLAMDEAAVARSGGGVSGHAGDGDGRVTVWRAVRRGTFEQVVVDKVGEDDIPCGVETYGGFAERVGQGVRPGHDGGLSDLVDARRRVGEVWLELFNAAEQAGIDSGREGCGLAAMAVIRGGFGVEEAARKHIGGRISDILQVLQISMVAGLEAVAGRVNRGR
ncbi:MAG: hypothetical protein QNI84_08025 [Henriciella sp.]|nr:hypothetical protein [Henriciella sp.]